MAQLAHAVTYNLGLKTATPFGTGASGCINAGKTFETENGPIFVKSNKKRGAETMFRGEEASLRAIQSTEAIICPRPLRVFQLDDGSWALAMTYVEMGGDRNEKALAHALAK